MSTVEQIVDATVVEDDPVREPSTALVAHSMGSTQLIQAASAAEMVAIATEIATALDAVIKAQGMRTKVGRTKVVKPDGREEWVDKFHVNVEAWQTVATFLGLAVVPQPSRRVLDPATGQSERVQYTVTRHVYAKGTRGADIKDGSAVVVATETSEVNGYSWECHVEVFKDGALLAAGDGMCSRTEETWRDRDDYALRGMAQTRATSRAIAGAAKWIVALAGYSTTPAEEYGAHEAPQGEPPEAGPEFGVAISPDQRGAAMDAIVALVELDREAVGSIVAREAAKDAARAIVGRAGYFPAVVADALGMVAAERFARRVAADDRPPGEATADAVAPTEPPVHPDAPRSYPTAGKTAPVTPPSVVRMLSRLADRRSLAEVKGAYAFARLTYPKDAQGDARFEGLTEAEAERLMKQLDPEGSAAAAPVPSGSVPMNDPRAAELCICKDGLNTPEPDTDDRCPLAGHGVPF